jgi:hypothetical protein
MIPEGDRNRMRYFEKIDNYRKVLFLIIVVAAAMIFDITMISLFGVINKLLITIMAKKILFVIITSTILTAAYFSLSRTAVEGASEMAVRLPLMKIRKPAQLIHFVLATLMVTMIVQLFLYSQYSTLLLIEVILCSYGISIAILCIFIFQMLRALSIGWNSIVIIIFITALATVMVNASIAVLDISLRISDWPTELRFAEGTADVSKGRYNFLDQLYFASYIISFVCAWVAGATMLSYYVGKLGKLKFWLLAIAPMIFFLGQFAPQLTTIFSSLVHLDVFSLAFLTTTIVILSKPIGGLMLASVFWAMARATKRNATIRNYLIIAGFGFLLLFTANQAISLSVIPFPPFGLPTLMVMVLAAYLLVIGLYTSAVSISTDAELRRSIKRIAKSHISLLDSMVVSDARKAIEAKAVDAIREESTMITSRTGINADLEEGEIKTYLDRVLQELRGMRKGKKHNESGDIADSKSTEP